MSIGAGGGIAAQAAMLQDKGKVPPLRNLVKKQIGDDFSGRKVRPAFDSNINKQKTKAPPVDCTFITYA